MEFRVRNQKYFKEYDGSDNECCWQMNEVGEDVEAVLKEIGVTGYDSMYEDWGAAFSWIEDGIEYCIQFECIDVEKAIYDFLVQGCRKKWLFFNAPVADHEVEKHPCVAKLRTLSEAL